MGDKVKNYEKLVIGDKVKNYENLYREYENLYWKELEENIKLHDEIDQLKWKIHILESKIKSLELSKN